MCCLFVVNQTKTCRTNGKTTKVKQETKYDKSNFDTPIMWCILFWKLSLCMNASCSLICIRVTNDILWHYCHIMWVLMTL